MSDDKSKTVKDALEELGQELFEANKCPDTHPVFAQLREHLNREKALLTLIDIPRYQFRFHYSYVKVSDIPEHFKKEFDSFFMAQTMLYHIEEPDEALLDTKRFESFIKFLKKKINP
ncbi:hypothetical protein [Acinetobacter pittii]